MKIKIDVTDMPKVDLHCHLEGCFRHSTLMSIGERVGIVVPSDPTEFRDDWLVADPVYSLEQMLERFERVRTLWCDEAAIRQLTAEAVLDADQQNVKILELRYSPDFIRNGNEALSYDAIHEAVLDGIDDAKQSCDIAVGLIGILRRSLPPDEASQIADFIIQNADTIDAIDLADREIGFPGRDFVNFYDRAKHVGMAVTVHAGEVGCDEGKRNIRDAIELLEVDRIGHGLHAHSDMDLLELVIDSKTPLELCPSSNVITGSIESLEHHPFCMLYENGAITTINTDDPALFGIDWLTEHDIVANVFGLAKSAVERCVEYAVAASFVSDAEKSRVWPQDRGPIF